jgi:hypothetical protein
MRNSLLLFAFGIILQHISYGQSEATKKKALVSIMPQVLFKNGIRFDIEKKSSRYSFTIAPQFYSGLIKGYSMNYDHQTSDFRNSKLNGYGIELIGKTYVKNNRDDIKPYIGLGFNYNHFGIRYEKEDWHSYIVDGIEYYSLDWKKSHQKINRAGVNFMAGALFFIDEVIFMDMYIGIGSRRSFIKDDLDKPQNFSSGFINYGYSGPVLLGGIKLGISL